MPFFSVVGFKNSTLTVYCLSSWFAHQQLKTFSNLCDLCWPGHLSWFQGPKDIPPSFLPWVTNHDVKNFKKSYFLDNCSFTQLFHDVEKGRRKTKIFEKVIQRFWYVLHVGLMFKKSTRRAKVATLIKFFNVEKTKACFPHPDFEIPFYPTLFNTYVITQCVLQCGRHYHIKGRRNIWSKNLDEVNDNIFFCQKIWLFGGWTETCLNQFVQKLSKITLHGN